jgi:hypothetical protein
MAKHRKSHRRRRHTKRRSTHRRRSHRMMYGGGATDINPANVGSFALGSKDLAAGQQYLDMHRAQHGGGSPLNAIMNLARGQMGGAAPLNTMGQSLIPSTMNDSARVSETYAQYGQIAGMKDQSGGRRRRRGRKGKKTHRRSRKMRGGALMLTPAEVGWKEAIDVPQGVNPQFASWDASA